MCPLVLEHRELTHQAAAISTKSSAANIAQSQVSDHLVIPISTSFLSFLHSSFTGFYRLSVSMSMLSSSHHGPALFFSHIFILENASSIHWIVPAYSLGITHLPDLLLSTCINHLVPFLWSLNMSTLLTSFHLWSPPLIWEDSFVLSACRWCANLMKFIKF